MKKNKEREKILRKILFLKKLELTSLIAGCLN